MTDPFDAGQQAECEDDMGADLYIRSISNPAYTAGKPAFEDACVRRDRRIRALRALGTPQLMIDADLEVAAAQKDVDTAYNAMYPDAGYFRDSYNSTSVLNRLGLSWWKDITPLLNGKGELTPTKAKTLIITIQAASLNLPTRAELEAGHAKVDDDENSVESWHRYYMDKREQLVNFLQRAVDLKEPIYCSL